MSCICFCCCCCSSMFFNICACWLWNWGMCCFYCFFISSSSVFSARSCSAFNLRNSTVSLPLLLFFAWLLHLDQTSSFVFFSLFPSLFSVHPPPFSCLPLTSFFSRLFLAVLYQQIPPSLWFVRLHHPTLCARVLSHSLLILMIPFS